MMRVGEGIKGGEDETGVRYFQSKVYRGCSANAFIQDLVGSKTVAASSLRKDMSFSGRRGLGRIVLKDARRRG
jgi:hypothetical protein